MSHRSVELITPDGSTFLLPREAKQLQREGLVVVEGRKPLKLKLKEGLRYLANWGKWGAPEGLGMAESIEHSARDLRLHRMSYRMNGARISRMVGGGFR